MHINPINDPSKEQQNQVEPTSNLPLTNDERYKSTLLPKEKGNCSCSIFYVVPWFFGKIGKLFAKVGGLIKDYILCCCRYKPQEERIDWSATKKVFKKIHKALYKDRLEVNVEEFRRGLVSLSKTAHDRFNQYIFYAIAEVEHKIDSQVEQEKWAKDHQSSLLLNDYYLRPDLPKISKVLRRAAHHFKNEIDRNS